MNDDLKLGGEETAVTILADAVEIPRAVHVGGERLQIANKLVHALAEANGDLECYVLLKQAEAIIKDAIDIQKRTASQMMIEKTCEVMGAKVEIKRSRSWDYVHPRLAEIEAEVKSLKEQEKAIKGALEAGIAEQGKATLKKDDRVISVTLPK